MRKLLSVLSSTLQGELRGGLLFFALLATTTLWAEDFSVGGIYYNYLRGNNVEVTYRGSKYFDYSNEYSGAVTIPETVTYNGITYSVTSIGDEAFYDCRYLTSITIPNSVTSIGNYAFYVCSWLTSITIPNSVTSIGDEAFGGCSSLTSITIPNSVKSIGDYAFAYCSSLTSITIPNSVTSIGYAAFAYCSSLTSINVDTNNPNYCSIDGVLFNKDKTTLIQYPIGNTRTEYTIPNSVTSIGEYAFYYCSSLTSITIPNSVTSIGEFAFAGCYSLISITIPNSVTSIGEGAFGNCSSLKSITIPNSVTSIGKYAFAYCYSLTSITIPNSVTSIGDWAFEDCSSLTTVICEAVEVPELGRYVFQNTPLSKATLYVPAESLDDYKAADQWKEFGTILPIAEAPSDTENVNCQLSTINCQKLLRNGQIIILRDGVEYNAQGAVIK